MKLNPSPPPKLSEKQREFLRAAARPAGADPWDFGSSVVGAMKRAGFVSARRDLAARCTTYVLSNAGREAMGGLGGAVRFRFVLRTVRGVALHVVEGPVQGAGGFVSRLADLEAQRALNALGRPLTIYEPDPGHVEVFPEYTAESNGPGVRVHISNLAGLAEDP